MSQGPHSLERRVEGQWGSIFGPQPVTTPTLTLPPGETLGWSWAGGDNQGKEVRPGEYRCQLPGGVPGLAGDDERSRWPQHPVH